MNDDIKHQATLDDQRHTIPVVLTGAQLASALCSAFDGGSTYWASRADITVPPKDGADVSAYLVPFLGGTLTVTVRPDMADEPTPRLLDLAAILDGVRCLAVESPYHFANLIRDNADANTGDALLQCAVFGDILF